MVGRRPLLQQQQCPTMTLPRVSLTFKRGLPMIPCCFVLLSFCNYARYVYLLSHGTLFFSFCACKWKMLPSPAHPTTFFKVRIEYARTAFAGRSSNDSSSRSGALLPRFIWSFGEILTLAGLLNAVLPKRSTTRLCYNSPKQRLAVVVVGTGALSLTSTWVRRSLGSWWVSRKLQNSACAIDDWNTRWIDQREYSSAMGFREDHNSHLLVHETNMPNGSSSHLTNRLDRPLTPRRLQKYQVRINVPRSWRQLLL